MRHATAPCRIATDIYGRVRGIPHLRPQSEAVYLVQTARTFRRRSKPAGCLIVLSALHPAERSDTFRQTLIAMRERTVSALRARLDEGVATDGLFAHAKLDAITRHYVTVQQGMSIQARDGASRRGSEGGRASRASRMAAARGRERRIMFGSGRKPAKPRGRAAASAPA